MAADALDPRYCNVVMMQFQDDSGCAGMQNAECRLETKPLESGQLLRGDGLTSSLMIASQPASQLP